MLDVGAGTGMVLEDWMHAVQIRPSRYVGIEPIEVHAVALAEAIDRLKITGEVDQNAYSLDHPVQGPFDLALFSHSAYWLTDAAGCIGKAVDQLSEDGVALAFLQSPIGIYNLFRLFDPLFARDDPSGPNQGFSSHELINSLRKSGYELEYEYIPSGFDLTLPFQANHMESLNEILSFALQVEFSELTDAVQKDVIEYLRAVCTHEEGRIFWNEPTAAVQVRGLRSGQAGNA